MWPVMLDISKIECKKSLRKLELDTYADIVSVFRAQGDLTERKVELLKELQSLLKISVDRHKAELRRATNDEKLYTIAKRLSHGECVSKEWIKQSKRLVPLLPSLQAESQKSAYYRILADHIVAKSKPILDLYPSLYETLSDNDDEDNHYVPLKRSRIENSTSTDTKSDLDDLDNQLRPVEDDKNLIYLANGYAVDSKEILVQNTKPNEFLKKHESSSNENDNSFLKILIKKFKEQQEEKQRLEKKLEQEEIEQYRIKSLNSKIITQTNIIDKNKQEKINTLSNPNNTTPKASKIKLNEPIDNSQYTTKHDLNTTPTIHPITLNHTSSTISPIKVTTAQALNILTSQQVKPVLAVPAVPVSVPMPVLQTNIVSLNSNLQFNQNGTSTSSTIVKLNPTQINFNNLGSIKKNTIVIPATTSSTSTPSMSNNLQTNSQQFKHIVIPKSNQKLIILPNGTSPTATTSSVNTNNKLNGISGGSLSIKQNIILNDNSSMLLQAQNINQIQKVCLLKSNSIPNELVNMTTTTNTMLNEMIKLDDHQNTNDIINNASQIGKNFKLANTASNSIKLNVAPPNLISNIQIISKHNNSINNNNNNNSENLKIINKIKLDECTNLNQETSSVVEEKDKEKKQIASLSSSSSTSSVTSSPPNWSDKEKLDAYDPILISN